MNRFVIEHAKVADRAELLDLLLKAFRENNPDHPPFDILYPELLAATDAAMRLHLIIRENGRITACVGVYPLDLRIGPVQVRVAGIGQVVCAPEARRGGRVSALLKHAVGYMAATLKCPLSWLGGRREFYAMFGWERAGSIVQLNLDGRSVGTPPEGWRVSQAAITPETADQLWELRNRQPVRQILTRQEWFTKLQRHGTEIWCATPDGSSQPTTFVVLNASGKQLCEWTGIDTGIHAIVATLVKQYQGVSLQLLPGFDPGTEFFWTHSVWTSGVMSNLLVADLPALLAAYAPLIEERLPPGKGLDLNMTAWQSLDSATARLGAGGENLSLDPLRMARFLFGPAAPSAMLQLPAHQRWLDQVFPLPFRLPLNSHL